MSCQSFDSRMLKANLQKSTESSSLIPIPTHAAVQPHDPTAASYDKNQRLPNENSPFMCATSVWEGMK